MRPFLACLLAVVLPAASFASQEPFCEDKISRTGRLFGRPAFYDLEESVPGFVYINKNFIRGRVSDDSWGLIGTLEQKLPLEGFKFKHMTFTMDKAEDFIGRFEGFIGRGQIVLKWPKSGASIVGRSVVGDFPVSGTSRISKKP
ncbi:hypothetical protein DFQ26_004497 [Actinomortierella ambigua]|nr:hypothetical protein DFQ26_004497 [Actinomortierella ambigua]